MTDRIVAGIVAKLYGDRDSEPSLAELRAARADLDDRIAEREKELRYDYGTESDALYGVVRSWAVKQGYVVAEAERKDVRDITVGAGYLVVQFHPWDYAESLEVACAGQRITFRELPPAHLLLPVLATLMAG